VGEVQLEVDALVAGGPEAGDGGELFVVEKLFQRVELELGRVALEDADPAGLDFEPLEGDALDEPGHEGKFKGTGRWSRRDFPRTRPTSTSLRDFRGG
jgi:hypothetical protein